MAINSEENLMDVIRQRTEEEDLKQRLRSTVGGYTKSSVMEYLTELRKQQQNSSQTFNQNMQALLDEKESLKADNEKLLMQIAQAKAEFLRLAESKKKQEAYEAKAVITEDKTVSRMDQSKTCAANDNIVYLKSSNPVMDSNSTDPYDAQSDRKAEVNALINTIADKEAELEKSKQEIKEQQELLAHEELEAKKQRDLISELTLTEEILQDELEKTKQALKEQQELLAHEKHEAQMQRELVSELSAASKELQDELRSLKERFSEEKLAKLNSQIAELTSNVYQQEKAISHLTEEASEKDDTIKTLLDENVTMMKSMELMSNSLDTMTVQNEKLLTANNALSQAYEDESKKVIKLINEKSEETVEKMIFARKLDEIMGSLAAYDLSKSDTSKNPESKTSIA